MLLTLETPEHQYYLRGANGEVALVNERELGRSFVIAPNQLLEDWAATDVRLLTPADLAPLIAMQPEVILIGSGATQAFPPAAALAAGLSLGIGVEVMTNAAAARTFNVLAGESRRVVAGFIFP